MSSAHSNSKLINLLQQQSRLIVTIKHHNCVETLQVLDFEELDYTNKEPCHFDL